MRNMLAVEFHMEEHAKAVAELMMNRRLFVAFDPINEGEAILWIRNEHNTAVAKMVTEALGLPDSDQWLAVVKDIRHEREL